MTTEETEVDIEPLENWEKFHILKVLERNRDVQMLEERRTTQLAVRLQLSRMSDTELFEMMRVMDIASGSWVNEIATNDQEGQLVELRRLLIRSIEENRTPRKLTLKAERDGGNSSRSTEDVVREDERSVRAGVRAPTNSSAKYGSTDKRDSRESVDDGLGSSESDEDP